MQRLVGIKKINELKQSLKRPLIESCIGELLPDFRTRNKAGFDVTTNWQYLKDGSDIPNLLKMVNKYCPIALVHGVYSMGTLMDVVFGDMELRVELKDNKIINTTVSRAFGSHSDEPIEIKFEGNDLKKVFKNKIVQNHIEYSILRRALLEQYSI